VRFHASPLTRIPSYCTQLSPITRAFMRFKSELIWNSLPFQWPELTVSAASFLLPFRWAMVTSPPRHGSAMCRELLTSFSPWNWRSYCHGSFPEPDSHVTVGHAPALRSIFFFWKVLRTSNPKFLCTYPTRIRREKIQRGDGLCCPY
jgi:hypothetical protein